MRLLLDSHVVIAEARKALGLPYKRFPFQVEADRHDVFASVASLWEIAIKSRLGKLDQAHRSAPAEGSWRRSA